MSLQSFGKDHALPDRIVLYAQKGWGKTTLGAFAPKPIILMSRGETGYLTLRRNNLVPDAPFAIIDRWPQLEAELRELIVKGAAGRETLVLDVLGGFERLCQEFTCEAKYGGDWGPKGFMNYMQGYKTAGAEFARILPLLDEVSAKLRLRIVWLSHSKVLQRDNPLGGKFDAYAPDCHEHTWQPINGWADAVLFGRFRTVVAKDGAENKGVGGTERLVHCQHHDAADAKNRHGLPAEIIMPKKPELMWATIGDKLDGAVDPNAASKAWAAGVAAKATPEGRATAASEALKPSEPAKPDQVQEASNVGEQVGNMFELTQLIEKYKMHDLMPKWHAYFRVKSLAELSDKQVADLINKIKAAKEAA